MNMPPQSVECADGRVFDRSEAHLVGSVPRIRCRDIDEAQVGNFPVLVEQSGSFRMFTYSRKIKVIAL